MRASTSGGLGIEDMRQGTFPQRKDAMMHDMPTQNNKRKAFNTVIRHQPTAGKYFSVIWVTNSQQAK
jgi:hypothetical protein